ncbi:MAG: hypothetical protein RJA63_384 [Pseudomonadota bacterium]
MLLLRDNFMTELYDLYIANPPRDLQSRETASAQHQVFLARGVRELGLALPDAQALLRDARACGANVYLVPVAYRHAPISLDQARAIAEKAYTQLIAQGRRLGALEPGYDDRLWWVFCADDIEAIEQDRYPGRVHIAIDKLDGHMRTKEELDAWLRLSTP